MELPEIIRNIEDHLFPTLKLTIRERSLYYHFFRHTRLIGKESATFAIYPLADVLDLAHSSVRESIREMEKKGCIQIDRSRQGHLVRLLLPHEIEGIIPEDVPEVPIDIETIDFFAQRQYLPQLIGRENGKCFYCMRTIRPDNCELDHVIPNVAQGDNSYKNIVASCHQCNTTKQARTGEDFLRLLYREGVLSQAELKERLSAIESLQSGRLTPEL